MKFFDLELSDSTVSNRDMSWKRPGPNGICQTWIFTHGTTQDECTTNAYKKIFNTQCWRHKYTLEDQK